MFSAYAKPFFGQACAVGHASELAGGVAVLVTVGQVLRAVERTVHTLAQLTVLGDVGASRVAVVVQETVALLWLNTVAIVVLDHTVRAEAALNAASLWAWRVVAGGQIHTGLLT
jgi:hypothetical protein